MVLSFQDDESIGTEKIWLESGFFGDQRAELTIVKVNFLENTLVYINQGTVSLVKGGEKAVHLDFIVLGQIMPAANVDPKLDLTKKMRSYYICLFTTRQQEFMVVLLKNYPTLH